MAAALARLLKKQNEDIKKTYATGGIDAVRQKAAAGQYMNISDPNQIQVNSSGELEIARRDRGDPWKRAAKGLAFVAAPLVIGAAAGAAGIGAGL